MGTPRARLARLGRHIRPAAGASAAPSTPWLERLAERVASLPEADKRGRRFDLNGSGGHQLPLPSDVVPLGVDESADGQLRALPSELQRVRAAAATAEAGGDEREAAVLRDLLHVVEPKPELSLADCCPTSVEACAAFFRREGFVCMRSVVSGEKLRDIQAAWARSQAGATALWHEAKATAGNFPGEDFIPEGRFADFSHGRLWYDTPQPDFWREPAFRHAVAPPAVVPVLRAIAGEGVGLGGVQPRTVPGPETDGGYTSCAPTPLLP